MILHVEKTQLAPDACRLELRGRLMMGNDSRQVEWIVNELLATKVNKIVLDLSNLDVLDSTGVGILVVCHGKIQKAGGDMRISGAQGIVLDTLMTTHVDRLVRMFPTAEAAGQSFVAA